MTNDTPSNNTMAIFDFDKTLVRIDSFRLFAHLIADTFAGRLWCLWLAVLCKCRFMSNTRYKERILEQYWFSRNLESQATILESLHHQLHLQKNDSVIERMSQHVGNGDTVAVMSASPEFLLKPFIQLLCPSARVWGSTVRLNGSTAVMNNLHGSRKEEVARTLIAEEHPQRTFVYTDHIVDLPLVRVSDQAILVRPSARFVYEVKKLGIPFETMR